MACFEVSLLLSTFAWMWELLHPQSERVGGAVAFWMSMLKCLAPRDADACSDLQGTSLWEEKLVRLFAAASTNSHYTHLCWVLQMAQMHKRYWVINKQNNTNKMLTKFCRCSSSGIHLPCSLGNICHSNWQLQEDEWSSIIVIFDINKDLLYTCLHGTVLFINGIVLMGFPSGHSTEPHRCCRSHYTITYHSWQKLCMQE